MKKFEIENFSNYLGKNRKLLRIMKLTMIFLMACFVQVSATVYSQNTKFTFDVKNQRLEEILRQIEDQSEFRFFYQREQVDVERKVNLDVTDQTVEQILTHLFKGKEVEFNVRNDKLILLKTAGSSPGNYEFWASGEKQQQQQPSVSGTVIDASGQALPGVTVVVKGTTQGTVTNSDGEYTLTGVPEDATLQFSFVGMRTQEIVVDSQTSINVTMEEETIGIEEVVAVGYGTQKRVNLTGSVTAIRTEEMEAISMPNISQAIMGRSPGLYIKNINAQPGDDRNVSINIRGFGTPLIIIDGMPATKNEFEQLNPNEIENFSVLKDAAAAAVYGARAGNGVVLVTTKRGTVSELKVTLNSLMQWQFFAVVPDWVGSEEYARMENVAKFNEGGDPPWTDEHIQKFIDGTDPQFANVDWWDKTIRPFAPQTQHSLSVQGGSERIKYFVTGGYLYQEAMPRANQTKNQRYNIRSNLDMAITNKMNLNLDLSAIYQDYIGPLGEMERAAGTSDGFMAGIFCNMWRSRPYYPFAFPDPTKIPGNRQDPYYPSFMENTGYKDWDRLFGDVKVGYSWDLPYGFTAKANWRYNKRIHNYKRKEAKVPRYTYNWDTDEYTQVGYTNYHQTILNQASFNTNFDQQYYLTWDSDLNDHNISAMVVYELLSDYYEWYRASRMRYEFDIDFLFAGPDLDKDNNGSASEGGRKGIISRINYDYKGKYLLEINTRNDASAKFPAETRWGFFPSASIAWRISEEGFIKNRLPFLTNLKLRASYGQLGYDATGDFQYLATYSITSNYIYDGEANELMKGIRADALPNPSITWEKMETTNAGVDFNLWNNLLEGSFDYFYRLRSDVLGTRIQQIPNIVGASMPRENYAQYDNRGWEFSLSHRNRVAGIDYSFSGNIGWTREKRVLIDQGEFGNEEQRRRGNRIGEWQDRFWGYLTDGLFQTKEEINNWADQDGRNNATVLPGDVRYVDWNGDGRITGDDQVIIGQNATPKLMYGLNLSAIWKQFDFNMLWQGAGAYHYNLRQIPDLIYVFYGNNTPLTFMYEDAYVPEGQPWLPPRTTDASWPRYRGAVESRRHINFTRNSNFWLIDGSYVRLKNIELGYTLPASLTDRWKIGKCKIFVSGYNLITFHKIDYLDPEHDTNAPRVEGSYYPPVGTYNIGLTLQF